jgi:hypothetical protein
MSHGARGVYPNTQIPKYPNTQIPKYPNTQIPKYPNTQRAVLAVAELFQLIPSAFLSSAW